MMAASKDLKRSEENVTGNLREGDSYYIMAESVAI